MIKFSATNVLVHYVSPVMEIESKSGGQPFYKRELIIDDSWDKDGKHYPSFVSIEFTGDKMNQLDSIFPGQRVNIEGMLSGREYNNRIYNTVRGLSVTPYQAQTQYSSAPAPAPAPAPMPGYPQGGYPQASPYPQQPMPGYPQASTPTYPQQQAPAQPQYQAQSAPPQQSYNSPNRGPGVTDLPWNNQ